MIISFKTRLKIYMRDGFCCHYCGLAMNPLADELTLDHVNPNGTSTEDNLVTACRPCNSKKGVRTVEEFRAVLAHEAQCKLREKLNIKELPIDLNGILDRLVEVTHIKRADVLTRSRQTRHVVARASFAILARSQGASFPEIGRFLKLHHSSVLHIVNKYSTTLKPQLSTHFDLTSKTSVLSCDVSQLPESEVSAEVMQ